MRIGTGMTHAPASCHWRTLIVLANSEESEILEIGCGRHG
jgi:protein-L-isoaspartate O-methyltransferase